MKSLRRILALLTAVCLVFPAMAAGAGQETSAPRTGAELEEQMVGTSKERIDEVTIAGRTCYMYVPQSSRVGNILALTPIIAVFGDEAFTLQSAIATAKQGGFAELAKRDGLCILFVNPIKSWDSAEDAAAVDALYAGIQDTYSSQPFVVFTEGKGVVTDKDADGNVTRERTVYPGSGGTTHFFAEGKGADYVAANYTTPKQFDMYYSIQSFLGAMGCPTGMALFAPNKLTLPEDTGRIISMAIVNGPENSEAFADAFTVGGGLSMIVEDEQIKGFQSETVISLYDDVISKYYTTMGQLREYPKYTVEGIAEINGTKTVSTGKSIEYYIYMGQDQDLTKKGSVPLLVWCHGILAEAEAMCSFSEWPLIARDEGFMVLSVDQNANFTPEEMLEMLDQVVAESPWIDTTRIYASGFSMGSAKTWSMAFTDPTRFAGIVPCALGIFGSADAYKETLVEGVIMPTFYFAGGQSAMELGSAGFTQEALKVLWPMNNLGDFTYDETAGQWGAASTSTTRLVYRDDSVGLLDEDARHQVLTIDAFESADGNVYTLLAVNEKKPHTITNNDAHIAWDFIKQFSRGADGKIVITEEQPSALRDTLTASMTGNKTERVDAVEVAGRTCYMYVPESARVGNFLANSPTVVVFGDTAFTAESALATAQKSFKEIAERDGLCILFVNPIESWDSAADAAAVDDLYAAFFEIYSSRPDVVFTNGKGTLQVKDADGNVTEERTVYPAGSTLHVFALGKGADYAAANLTTPHSYRFLYAFQLLGVFQGCPSGMALFAPNKLNVPAENSQVIAMGIVNGPNNADEFATAFQSANAGIWRTVRDNSVTDFDGELVTSLYDEIVRGQVNSNQKLTVNGIIEVNKTKTTAAGKAIEYYEYIPENLDVTQKASVPVLLYFHGGAAEAEFMVASTGWLQVAKQHGLEVISMDQHQYYYAEEVVEILDQILAERTYLDPTRVYAGGFSMGGGKTWNVGLKCTNRFAGIIPTAAGTMAEGADKYEDHIVAGSIIPVFYVAGGVSFLAELPKDPANNVNQVLDYLWTVNNLGEYTFNADANCRFAQDYTTRLTIPYLDTATNPAAATQETLTIYSFPSKDGMTYTYLCINANKSHTQTQNDALVAWEYMRHFSRTQDGEIYFDGKPVELAKAASAGSYVAKAGDTWGKLALDNYGTLNVWQQLMKANGNKPVSVGMTVTLPATLGKYARLAPQVLMEGETLYTVKAGDTLGQIAVSQYGNFSMYKAIFERNSDRVKNVNLIYEGQVLVLPVK